jgi:hypothetical protein
MSKASIQNLTRINKSVSINSGLFIIAIDHTPPHIGLIVNNKYYSFSARGTIIGLALDKQIIKINRLKLASVIVDIDIALIEEDVVNTFQKLSYTKLDQSCFLPILEVFRSSLTIPSDCKYLFHFIPYIYSLKKIKNAHYLNADHLLDSTNSLELNNYGQEAINNAIEKSTKHAKV